MRGKVDVFFTFVIPGRITPAYAGKRISLHTVCRCLWDHPRVCGEKVTDFHLFWHFGGSPPRMRGKETGKTRRVQWPGITPAYAGKRIPNSFPSCSVWDHPRVCGEKIAASMCPIWVRGSPPRMRGKAPLRAVFGVCIGITPAYAGKRLKRSHRIGHFSCILCLFHSVLHRASASGGSRAGPCAPPCLPAQNAVPV